MNRFIFLMMAPFILSAQESGVVITDPAAKLTEVTIAPFEVEESSLGQPYIDALEEVFRSDFCLNGRCIVVENEGAYNIGVKVHGRELTVSVNSGKNGQNLNFEPIFVTGYLDEDRQVVHLLSDGIYQALFNQDGVASSKFLYTQKDGFKTEVWEADYDGGNARQLTENNGHCTTPCYLPAKSGLMPSNFFFVGHKTGLPKIYLASTNGKEVQRVATFKGEQILPDISREGNGMVFLSDEDGSPALYYQVFNLSRGPWGEPRKIYEEGIIAEGKPSISPNGKEVVFVAEEEDTLGIYLLTVPAQNIPLEKVKAERIVEINQEDASPAWSPDGKKIAYVSEVDGIEQIFLFDLKKKKVRQLTQGGTDKKSPSWAANNLDIMYSALDADGVSQIYRINLNQPEAVQVTTGSGDKRFPNFIPG